MKRLRLFVVCTACVICVRAADEAGRLRLVAQTGFTAGLAVAVSPDGRFALTGDTRVARLWHLETGRELRRLVGSGQEPLAVRFSLDGHTAFTAGDGGTIRAWDVDSGIEKWRKDTGAWRLQAAAISEDGHYAAVSPEGKPLQIWDLATVRLVNQLPQSYPNLNALAITKSLKLGVALGSSVIVAGAKKSFLHPAKVVAIAFSPDEKLLAAAAEDAVARIWNIESGAVVHELRGHKFGPFGVAFSLDGSRLFTGSDMDRVWDVQSGQLLRVHDDIYGLGGFAFTPDGRCGVGRSADVGQGHLDRTATCSD